MVDDDRMEPEAGEQIEMRRVRFRSLGDYPLSGAVEGEASDVYDIIRDIEVNRQSERAGRLIDGEGAQSMERKEGGGLLLMKALIRVVVCGSVDDGKSTLLGRLLAETGSIPEDQLEPRGSPRRPGSTIPLGEVDYSPRDGRPEAEREQGITIDVAYRHLMLPAAGGRSCRRAGP